MAALEDVGHSEQHAYSGHLIRKQFGRDNGVDADLPCSLLTMLHAGWRTRGAGTKPSLPIISLSIVLRLTIRANSAGPTLFPACESLFGSHVSHCQSYRGQSLVYRMPTSFTQEATYSKGLRVTLAQKHPMLISCRSVPRKKTVPRPKRYSRF